MKYTKPYLLETTYRTDKHMVDYQWKERKTKAFTFTYGKYLPCDTGNPNLEYTKNDPKDYDLIFHAEVEPAIFCKYDNLANNGNGLLLVNKKIIDILTSVCPNDIQTFPAVIVPEKPNKMTFENHDYWVLNLTNTVDVIDEDHSEFERWEDGDLKNLKKVMYKENSMNGVHIGRQYNYLGSVILSPELVKIFKKEKVTGVKFIKDSEYSR
jgi:hypothetical protein